MRTRSNTSTRRKEKNKRRVVQTPRRKQSTSIINTPRIKTNAAWSLASIATPRQTSHLSEQYEAISKLTTTKEFKESNIDEQYKQLHPISHVFDIARQHIFPSSSNRSSVYSSLYKTSFNNEIHNIHQNNALHKFYSDGQHDILNRLQHAAELYDSMSSLHRKIKKPQSSDPNSPTGSGGSSSGGGNDNDNDDDDDDDKDKKNKNKKQKETSSSRTPKSTLGVKPSSSSTPPSDKDDNDKDNDKDDKKKKTKKDDDDETTEDDETSKKKGTSDTDKDSDTKDTKKDRKKSKLEDLADENKDKDDKDDDDDDDELKAKNPIARAFLRIRRDAMLLTDKKKRSEMDPDDRKRLIRRTLLDGTAATIGTLIIICGIISSLKDANELAQISQHSYNHLFTKYLNDNLVKRFYVHDNTIIADIIDDTGKHIKYPFDVIDKSIFSRKLATDMWNLKISDIPIMNTPSIHSPIFTNAFMSLLLVWGSIRVGFSQYFSDAKSKGGPPTDGNPLSSLFNKDINKHKFTVVESSPVRFKDVAGMDEAKAEIVEFVDFLRDPTKYHELGARLPKGALLSGPPGTGKTLLAKAVAGEAGVPFFSISGSEFVEKYVGMGAYRVRQLFKQARARSPAIIFIDEIDAVARTREQSGGHSERENTLNQLLIEMDGFKSNEKIIVIAATNRADMLDSALLRPGRIDRRIGVELPDFNGRRDILLVHLQKITLNIDIPSLAGKLAGITPGMSGADLANICNEAAISAARSNKDHVDLIDFELAIERVIGGVEIKKRQRTKRNDTKIVAYHESGHAVAGWFLKHANPLMKVTIIPRSSGALGFAQYLPSEDKLYDTDQFLDQICVSLAGRAAEDIIFGKISTGASDDLKKVVTKVHDMVMVYGMSSILPNMAFGQLRSDYVKPISETTSQLVDAEIERIVKEQYTRVRDLLVSKRDILEKLSLALLEKETIGHDQLVEVLGERPYTSPIYTKYIQAQEQTVRIMTDEERTKAEADRLQRKKEDQEKEKENERLQEIQRKKDKEDKKKNGGGDSDGE